VASALVDDAAVWRRGVELMIGDLADGELLPGRIYLCGGGAQLPQITAALSDDDWWRRLPFARRPQVAGLNPSEVTGLRDATATLTTQQDVTPMALARQALILDAQATAAERAMRRAMRAMQL
jgi:cell division protein FtsA